MTKSVKAEQLRTRIQGLNSALVAGSADGSNDPVAPKTTEGSDRFGGFPPA